MRYSTTLLAAALCICAAAQAAQAESPAASPFTTLHYSSADTASPAAAKKLYQRLLLASEAVCDTSEGDTPLWGDLWRIHDCVQRVITKAVSAVNKPLLTAYAAAHGVTVGAPIRVAALTSSR